MHITCPGHAHAQAHATRCAHAGITRIARIFKMSKNMQGMMVLARTLQKSVSALSMLVRPVACVVRWVA